MVDQLPRVESAVGPDAGGAGDLRAILEPGSYRVNSVLANCGGISFDLVAADGHRLAVGTDLAPYVFSSRPPNWHFDGATGIGYPHSTTYQTNLTVSTRQTFTVESNGEDMTYNNKDRRLDLTMTPM
jgi:hypothetical protein